MVSINEEEAQLAVMAIECKIQEYKDYPPEVQQFFLTPYLQFRESIMAALEKEQKLKSSLPKDKKN